jgi:hypothetical protein
MQLVQRKLVQRKLVQRNCRLSSCVSVIGRLPCDVECLQGMVPRFELECGPVRQLIRA